jgi:hypothetical protein|tara:strand:+ start:260 stop:487 length:228 start_codon:yes stop_codon:yes gene_type:complete
MGKPLLVALVPAFAALFFSFLAWTGLTLIEVDKRTETALLKIEQNHAMIKPMWEAFVRDRSLADGRAFSRAGTED